MFNAIKEFFMSKFKKEEAKPEAPYKLEAPVEESNKKPVKRAASKTAKPKKPRVSKL